MKKYVWQVLSLLCACSVLVGCSDAGRAYDQGMEAFCSGDYQSAGDHLKKALEKNKERAEYYIGYGMVLNEQGRYKEAIRQFERAYQDTDNSIARVNNKQLYYGEAISYYHLRDHEKGLELCDQALELPEPSSLDGRILCSKAVMLEEMGDQERALECYRKVIKEDPQNWQAYYRLGAICQREGDEDAAGQARKSLEKALEDGTAQAAYYLGILAADVGDTAKAEEYLESYVSGGEGDFLSSAYRGLAYCALQKEDHQSAERYLESGRGSAAGAEEQAIWREQIILLEKQGKYRKARRTVREYLQKYPDDREMKKELRFLRTRSGTAKGRLPVISTAEPESMGYLADQDISAGLGASEAPAETAYAAE